MVDDNRTLKSCTLVQRDWCAGARCRLFESFEIPPRRVVTDGASLAEFVCTLQGQTFVSLVRTLRVLGHKLSNSSQQNGRMSFCVFRGLMELFKNVQNIHIQDIHIARCATPSRHSCLKYMQTRNIRRLELFNITCTHIVDPQTMLLTRLVPTDTLSLSRISLYDLSTLGTNTINVSNLFLEIAPRDFGQLADVVAPNVSSCTCYALDVCEINTISPLIVKLSRSLTTLHLDLRTDDITADTDVLDMTLPIAGLNRLRSLTLGITPVDCQRKKLFVEIIMIALLNHAPPALHHLRCKFLVSPWVFQVKAEILLSAVAWRFIEAVLPRFTDLPNFDVDFEVQRLEGGGMKPDIIRAVSNLLREDILRIFRRPPVTGLRINGYNLAK